MALNTNMVLKQLFNSIKGFLMFSNVHGFRYVADEEIPWIGRLFWITSIILCYIASYFLILSAYDNYENNSISFVSDTAYLHWDSAFPAIIVCEIESERAEEYADEIWGDDASMYAPDIFNEIGFFRGTASLIKDQCSEQDNKAACNMNYTLISEKLRRNCSTLFKKCTWNGIEYECCTYFKPLKTELGLCYALNSMQTENDFMYKGFTVNRKESIPATLVYQFTSSIETYILSREEVPSLQIPDYEYKANPGNKRQYFISVKEIDNDPAVKNIAMKHRKCRYPDESYLTVQKYYSLMGCIIEERKKGHYKFCNCTHQLMPNSKRICNLEGLLCISKHFDDLTVIKPKWSKKQGLVVDCLPSCVENEINVIHAKKSYLESSKKEYGEVVVKLIDWPTERFKRTVVRGTLDLVVSIGGTVGLFIGASVLSIIEIFYYFGFRIWTIINTQNQEINAQQLTNTNSTNPPDLIHVGYKLATNKDNEIILIKSKNPNEIINKTPTYTFSY